MNAGKFNVFDTEHTVYFLLYIVMHKMNNWENMILKGFFKEGRNSQMTSTLLGHVKESGLQTYKSNFCKFSLASSDTVRNPDKESKNCC